MKAESGLRVGVVGCGYWGSKHVRTLMSLEAVSSVCVIDPSDERRAAVTRVYPRVDEYKTLGERAGKAGRSGDRGASDACTRRSRSRPSRGGCTCWSRSRLAPTVEEARGHGRCRREEGRRPDGRPHLRVPLGGVGAPFHGAARRSRRAVLRGHCSTQPGSVPARRQRGLRPRAARRLHPELRARIVSLDGRVLGISARAPTTRGRRAPAGSTTRTRACSPTCTSAG